MRLRSSGNQPRGGSTVVLAVLVVLAALAACGGASESSSTPATVPVAAAGSPARPPTSPQWWCYTLPGMDIGSCFAQKLGCEMARRMMMQSSKDPSEQITECAPQPQAVCFDLQHSTGRSEHMCHPTMAMCRDHADHEQHAPGIRKVGACASTGAVLAATDDPHWWCISFARGTLGSCSRSKVRCEADRNHAIELERDYPADFPEIDVSNCTPQPTAQCFEVRKDSDVHQYCHPTIETCRDHRLANPEQNPTNCRAAD